MTSVKKIAKAGEDESTKEMFSVVECMRNSHADSLELAKLVAMHHKAAQKYAESGKAMVEHLFKLSLGMDSRVEDISQSVTTISSSMKSIFNSFDEMNKVMMEQLSVQLQKTIEAEKKSLDSFEKGFKAKHNQLLADLRKAEKESQKAGKKSPQALQAAIQAITDKMSEIKDNRRERLNAALLMERKKQTDFLTSWVAFVDAQMETYAGANATLAAQRDGWSQLGQTTDKLHEKSKRLLNEVALKERTATSIDEGGADEGYYEDEGYYDEGDEEYYEEAAGTFYARALYDYQGTHDYELKFRAGDTITVTNVDEATGWWTGELNGVVGPFPGNYVEALE